MFDGFIAAVLDILGMIRDPPRPTVWQQEENELLEALALSLSLTTPMASHQVVPPADSLPAPRPAQGAPADDASEAAPDSPPPPPADRPTGAQRAAHHAFARLPVMAPPHRRQFRFWPR